MEEVAPMTEHQRLARRVDGIAKRLDKLERSRGQSPGGRSPQQQRRSPPLSGGFADEVGVLEIIRDVRQELHGLKDELHRLAHHVNQYMDIADQQDTASQCSGESASAQSIASAQNVAELLRGRGRHRRSRQSDRSQSRSSSCHGAWMNPNVAEFRPATPVMAPALASEMNRQSDPMLTHLLQCLASSSQGEPMYQ